MPPAACPGRFQPHQIRLLPRAQTGARRCATAPSPRWLSIGAGVRNRCQLIWATVQPHIATRGCRTANSRPPRRRRSRAAFAREQVDYLFIGKSGAILLGYPETTQDVDIFSAALPRERGAGHPRVARAPLRRGPGTDGFGTSASPIPPRAGRLTSHAFWKERIDFVQINYSLMERGAEERVLPVAKERGVAVIVNRPFGRGDLFGRVWGSRCPNGRRRLIVSPGLNSSSGGSWPILG